MRRGEEGSVHSAAGLEETVMRATERVCDVCGVMKRHPERGWRQGGDVKVEGNVRQHPNNRDKADGLWSAYCTEWCFTVCLCVCKCVSVCVCVCVVVCLCM